MIILKIISTIVVIFAFIIILGYLVKAFPITMAFLGGSSILGIAIYCFLDALKSFDEL